MSNLRLFMWQGALLIGSITLSFSLAGKTFAQTNMTSPPVHTVPLAAKAYARLQQALSFYEIAASHPETFPWPTIPETKLLHSGDRDSAILLIRQRLRTTGDLAANIPDSKKYDDDLEKAIIRFQWRHGLKSDGVIGEHTREAMNVSPQDRVKQIQINMQRWAHLEKILGNRFVMVNVPEFQLHLFDHDQERLTMKVIVGKPSRPTPDITSKITRLIFNPRWSVPHLIAQRDIVPKVLADPNYLSNNQIRIFNNEEANAYEISPQEVDWSNAQENGFHYHFKQDPGFNNALGLVKFEFVNTHDIYLHDTPSKNLFDQEIRAFSSGCVRLEKPFSLVDYLTQGDASIDHDIIREKLNDKTTAIFKLDHSIPIIITYITAWVDNNNIAHFINDIYGEDGMTASVQARADEEMVNEPEQAPPENQSFSN